MPYPQKDIQFVVYHLKEEFRLKTCRGEYADLRALIINKIDLPGFGQCGGMGRCATCMVRVNSNLYLSCQVAVSDVLANALVQIV